MYRKNHDRIGIKNYDQKNIFSEEIFWMGENKKMRFTLLFQQNILQLQYNLYNLQV